MVDCKTSIICKSDIYLIRTLQIFNILNDIDTCEVAPLII